MNNTITTDMLNDEGIRSALELLQQQVSRYDAVQQKRYIPGEKTITHQLPAYYVNEFILLSKKLKSRRYHVLLASLILMMNLPEDIQICLIKNAGKQFNLLRDSEQESLNIRQMEQLTEEISRLVSGIVDARQGM